MYSNGRESGVSAIKQEENATGVDAFVDHVKLVEVKYENEYLASDGHARPKEIEVRGNGVRGPFEDLQGQMESLKRELLLEKQTRNAAEEALKHLQEVYSKADSKVQEITTRLAEAQQKMDQEMLAQGGKNAEPDSTLNRLHEHEKHHVLEVPKAQDAQRISESCIPENEKHAQHQVPSIWPSASSSSSSSDCSSDGSENDHGEPSNAIPNATVESEESWEWLEDWNSEESYDYPTLVAFTELLRHAEKVLKQIKDLESVNPYRSSRAILHGSHHERAREMRREMMRKKVWNCLGMEVIAGLLRHVEHLSEHMKRRQPKRKRELVDINCLKRLAKDLRAPGKGSRRS